MELRAVIRTHGRGNAALRIAGVALPGVRFGEDDDLANRRERNSRPEAGDAAADDDEVEEVRRGSAQTFECYPTASPARMNPIRIDVPTPSRRYTITLGDGVLAGLPQLLDEAGVPARRFLVSNALVWRLVGPRLAKMPVAERILLPDGERYKQVPTVQRVYDSLIRANADRASAIITLGGGVLGDMAGFAAATYLRGIALVHVPTTLLAQVDSSIGGKVGVNHTLGKNLIGSFHQPHAVVIDPSVLGTLPRREFRAGLYEVVKYGMTSSPALFDRIGREHTAIFAKDPVILTDVIAESCRIKAAVVVADEKESGLRRILNFGHTAGHALEAVTKYRRFRHGEAVAYGMLVAAQLAVARGALADRDRKALASLIASLGPLPPVGDVPSAQVLEVVKHDKKVVAGKLHFVLPTAIGATAIVDDVTEKELKAALRKIGFRA
jgi:3-dehydroquinate synthase